MIRVPTAISWFDDVESAAWVAQALRQHEGTTASVVPPLFVDYAHIAPADELGTDEYLAALTALLRQIGRAHV